MTPLASQPLLAGSVRALAVAAVALGLGGCLGRGTETTGSLASSSPTALRESAESLGARYDQNPNDADTAMAYAQTLRANGQNTQAVAVLRQTAIRNPKSLPVLAAYGKALADNGQLREAADVLSRAHHPERPDWRILSVQGAVADQLGDFAAAQRLYDTALRIAPGEPSILSNQGLSLALNKRLPEAEAVLRQASVHPRADLRVRQNLALVLGLQGKFGEAEELLRRDLPPAEVAQTLASVRRMVSQPNSWKAMRQAETPAPARTRAEPRA